ncbi:MAG: glycosyltransferase family 39 protein [bacterium]|nr:glycosyltransferase family 39 protein [bacterium]
MPSNNKLKTTLTLGVIIIIAGFLRLLGLGHKPFWADEGIAWYMAQGRIEHDAPVVYSFAFNWAIQLFGPSEFAARLPSALYGLLSIIVIYAIGKTVLDRRFGIIAAALAGLSAYLIPLSQELRHYSLVGLELWLALWIFLQILKSEKPHRGWWVSLLLVGVIGEYTHCFFILALAYFGAVYAWKRGIRQWTRWRTYAAVFAAILLISLPQWFNSLKVAGERPHVSAAGMYDLQMNGYRVARSYFSFLFGDFLTNLPGKLMPYLHAHPLYLAAGICMIIIWIAVAIRGFQQVSKITRQGGFSATALYLMLGMMAAFTALFCVVIVSSSGHLIFVYVPFLFIIAAGFMAPRSLVQSALAGVLILFTVAAINQNRLQTCSANERADWRAAGALLQQQLRSDDAVLLLRSRNVYYTLLYYDQSLKGDIYYIPRHEPAREQDSKLMAWWNETSKGQMIDSLLKNHLRVWVIESDRDWKGEGGFGNYSGKIWNFGDDLQVHLIRKVGS